jgi:hypothetical protein
MRYNLLIEFGIHFEFELMNNIRRVLSMFQVMEDVVNWLKNFVQLNALYNRRIV